MCPPPPTTELATGLVRNSDSAAAGLKTYFPISRRKRPTSMVEVCLISECKVGRVYYRLLIL